ncbi:MAG: ribosome silencing factor [Acholeplasmataceae bacterium]
MDKVKTIIDQLETVKAKDIKVFDLKGQSPFYDYFIIGTTTDRQSNAAISYIKKAIDPKEIKQVEGNGTSWMLMDCYDVIIHLFHEEDRQFYNLDERLMEFMTPHE